MISPARVKEVALYYREHGLEKTIYKFELEPSTVERYLRAAKEPPAAAVTPPKILLLDIETAPMLTWVWGLYKQRISIEQIERESFIICWAAKWLHAPNVMSDCVTPKEARKNDDERIMQNVWKQLNEADIVIGHNVAKFDLRKINWRFAEHGILPPSPFQIIDTYKATKKVWGSPSHKQGYFVKKKKTDYEWWKECCHGDQEKLNLMEDYCRSDVNGNEELFYKVRPYAKNFPNQGLYTTHSDSLVCSAPACGSTNLVLRGNYTTPMNQYNAYQCEDCGSWSRDRKGISYKERKHLTRSLAR